MKVKYYAKYLKYKNKYTLLKKQMGGCDVCHDAKCINGEKCGAGKKMTVINWSGDELCEITVLPTDNTNKLFQAIQEVQGVPIDQQHLSLENGTPIKPDHTFESYEITENSTIRLTIVEDTSTKFYFTDDPETSVVGELSELKTRFADRKAHLKRVIVGTETTTLGRSTFEDCMALESVEFPSSVTSMDDNTFYGCESLKNVILSENLTTLGNDTFTFCQNLERIKIPSSVTSMGYSTFYNCRSLVDVHLSENLTSLDKDTFAYCDVLRRLEIPASVTSIGNRVFSSCNMLRTVVIHNDGEVTFDDNQEFPDRIRFYTNSPTVTAYLIENYGQYIVFPKHAAPPITNSF